MVTPVLCWYKQLHESACNTWYACSFWKGCLQRFALATLPSPEWRHLYLPYLEALVLSVFVSCKDYCQFCQNLLSIKTWDWLRVTHPKDAFLQKPTFPVLNQLIHNLTTAETNKNQRDMPKQRQSLSVVRYRIQQIKVENQILTDERQ